MSKFRANNYIERNLHSVNPRYRHSYHVMPEIGWCNDPNGFSWYNGKIHLFYQYNPYSSAWDTMHWGHVTTTDMIRWAHEPVALAPDMAYDKHGCFSGSAIEKDGKLYLMYTGVGSEGVQQQCIALSSDGVAFDKPYEMPIIGEDAVGDGMSKIDFRDPYVFCKEGVYYCLTGTKAYESGNIALYRSLDLEHWEFVGYAFDSPKEGEEKNDVYECPSFVETDGKQVLICSPKFMKKDGNRFENVHSVVYAVGKLDLQTGRFVFSRMEEIDGGFDFYAAQTTKLPDGRTVMTAWMQMWDRSIPSQPDGWAGAMILPRELRYKDGVLYQSPVREIEQYRRNAVKAENVAVGKMPVEVEGIRGKTVELLIDLAVDEAKECGVKLFCGGGHETLVYYDAAKREVVFDRSRSGVQISGAESDCSVRRVSAEPQNGILRLRIFLDNTSVEVFVNDGAATLTGNVYPDAPDDDIAFYAKGGNALVKNVIKYDIIV